MHSSRMGANTSIDEVRARFEQWRAGRLRKARIPDELWPLAIEAARREGVNRAAQELHLDGAVPWYTPDKGKPRKSKFRITQASLTTHGGNKVLESAKPE